MEEDPLETTWCILLTFVLVLLVKGEATHKITIPPLGSPNQKLYQQFGTIYGNDFSFSFRLINNYHQLPRLRVIGSVLWLSKLKWLFWSSRMRICAIVSLHSLNLKSIKMCIRRNKEITTITLMVAIIKVKSRRC